MCVIIALSKGQAIPFEKLKNATLNNPHGFGLIMTNEKKLNVYHKFDPKGNDPEVVAKQLEKNKDADMRYLHLRFRTRGDSSTENTHPFTVFKRDNRRIEFMHNGSLNRFQLANETKKSDSRMFAENFLSPFLSRWVGDNGPGDIEDILAEEIIDNFFGVSNRGLLVANDLDPLFLGKWSTIDDEEKKGKVVVSNDDYFGWVQSGRVEEHYKNKWGMNTGGASSNRPFDPTPQNIHCDTTRMIPAPLGTAQMLPVKVAPAPTTTPTASTSKTMNTLSGTKKALLDRPIEALKEVDLRTTGRFLLPSDIAGLYDPVGGELDDELITYISALTLNEIKSWVEGKGPDSCARLIEHLFVKAAELIQDNEYLSDDKRKA